MPKAPAVWTVLSMLEWASSYFEEKEVPGPRLSIEWLLAEVLGVRRLDLYLMYDRPLHSSELEALKPLMKRRAIHEPLQYITGSTDFYSVVIEVEPGVLIPRPETEELVEMVIKEAKSREAGCILDVGTGSGCIAIALKKELSDWDVIGADISKKALTIARRNADLNNTSVHFMSGDLFDVDKWAEEKRVDILVSNPPYIGYDEMDAMEKQVKEHEPREALFCEDVTAVYRSLGHLGTRLMNPSGLLLTELNPKYADQILTAFPEQKWEKHLHKDLAGKLRFLAAKKLAD